MSRSLHRNHRPAVAAALACLALGAGCSSDDADTWPDGSTEREVKYSADPTPTDRTPSERPSERPSASLEVRHVVSEHASDDVDPAEGNVLLLDPASRRHLELGPVVLDSSHVEDATIADPDARWVVRVEFTEEGSALFSELTAAAACKRGSPENRIALVVDDEIVSAPGVQVPCGQSMSDETIISGDFTEAEAIDLAGRIAGD